MNSYCVTLASKISNLVPDVQKATRNKFNELYDKVTGGKMAEYIRENYNITLEVGGTYDVQQILDTHDMNTKNYVHISSETLLKMEKDPDLRVRILSKIEEFCSQKEQREVMKLQPPVKSSGMIIYPDGKAHYWLESYSNNVDSKKQKEITEDSLLSKLFSDYRNLELISDEINLAGMAALRTTLNYK